MVETLEIELMGAGQTIVVFFVTNRDDDGPDYTKCPGADGRYRNIRVIGIGNSGSDFGIGGVVL